MAREDSFDIFGADPFGRDIIYGLSTGQERLGLQPPPQGLPVDTRPYDRMQATPRGFISGLFSDVLGGTFNMPQMPRTGIPAVDVFSPNINLFNKLALGDVQKTAERISYGQPLTTGSGMTLRPREEAINAAMTVIPLVGQGGRVANQAAMNVGRAGERLAERVVPQVMERGGLPAQLLGDISRGSVSPLDVYHGTPYTFPPTPRNPLGEFDASKIGTGEGAQVYGRGIYTAEARPTGERYRSQLAPEKNVTDLNQKMRFVKIGDKPISPDTFDIDISQELIDAAKSGKKEFLDFANQKKSRWEQLAKDESYKFQPYAEEKIKAYDDLIKETEKSGVAYTGAGNLYKVNLPDEKIATMLDWDKPITEQEMISLYDRMQQTGLTDFAKAWQDNFYESMNRGLPTTDGQDLLIELTKQLGSPKNAADYLQGIGVAGIKYLDEFSRVTKYKGDSAYLYAGKDFKENGYSLENALEGMKQAYKDANPQELKDALDAVYTPQTRNFVVFPNEEKSMTILERNDIPASQVDNPAFTDPFGNTIGSSIR
jgi:hypothetical protein